MMLLLPMVVTPNLSSRGHATAPSAAHPPRSRLISPIGWCPPQIEVRVNRFLSREDE